MATGVSSINEYIDSVSTYKSQSMYSNFRWIFIYLLGFDMISIPHSRFPIKKKRANPHMVNPLAWERSEILFLDDQLDVGALQTALLHIRQSLVDSILLVDGVDQLGLVVLFSNTPEIGDQVVGSIAVAGPTQVVLALEGGNQVGADALAVVAADVSVGLHRDTQIAQGSLQDFGIGDLGTQCAKVRHLGILLVELENETTTVLV